MRLALAPSHRRPKQCRYASAQPPHPSKDGSGGVGGGISQTGREQTDARLCDFSVILESILSNFAICPGGNDGSAELICRLLALLRLYRTSFWNAGRRPAGAARWSSYRRGGARSGFPDAPSWSDIRKLVPNPKANQAVKEKRRSYVIFFFKKVKF